MLHKLNILSLSFIILLIITLLCYNFKTNINQNPKKKFKIISPQCVMGAINSNKNVLIVNVLSDKMPVYIGSNKIYNKSISKTDFEEILKKNDNQIPNEIDLVIFMCAAWSCGAGEGYYNELIKRKINVNKIVDYAGGIHEWCLYNILNSNKFNLFKKYKKNMTLMKNDEVLKLLKDTAHNYKTNLLINENNTLISDYCLVGKKMSEYLT